MTDLAEINGAVATAQNKPDAQIADELTATEVQPFRLLDLPDELWVRIGKMVIDNSPGVTTPDNMSDAFASIMDSVAGPFPNSADYIVGAYLTEVQSKIKQYREKVLRDHFPPLPAITQTTSALRNELLAYYYHTKISLTFTWRDLKSTEYLCAWLQKTDPQRHRMSKVESHTYLEYLRSELGLEFEVIGQTEYEAAPEYREWKGTIAFK
ncbi:unnamed protein product [Zymoseptoria tritici ST99CH_3D1]|nr:unnamed protein product [Zymoseptoria tritici ST99CH_3D1]